MSLFMFLFVCLHASLLRPGCTVHLHMFFHLDLHVPSCANLCVFFLCVVLLAVAVLFCHERPSTGLLCSFLENVP